MVTSLWHGDQQLRIPRGFRQVSSATVKGMHSAECSSDSVLCFMLPVPEQHDGNCLYWLIVKIWSTVILRVLLVRVFCCFFIYAILHIVCPSVVCVLTWYFQECVAKFWIICPRWSQCLFQRIVVKNPTRKSWEKIMQLHMPFDLSFLTFVNKIAYCFDVTWTGIFWFCRCPVVCF